LVPAVERVAHCLKAIDRDDDLRLGLRRVKELKGDWLVEESSRSIGNPCRSIHVGIHSDNGIRGRIDNLKLRHICVDPNEPDHEITAILHVGIEATIPDEHLLSQVGASILDLVSDRIWVAVHRNVLGVIRGEAISQGASDPKGSLHGWV